MVGTRAATQAGVCQHVSITTSSQFSQISVRWIFQHSAAALGLEHVMEENSLMEMCLFKRRGPSCSLQGVEQMETGSRGVRTNTVQHETLQHQKAAFTRTVIQHWEAKELAPLDVFKAQWGVTLSKLI
ncbi:hypothetical protein WISP_122331 [Willisornis vidua]|uniref:Uncharacterized protein n=1 Tax=Willisornis vidua TaxID=1566151 RepID=A0ABQ9CS43_9PASS|nr:hypothetical protein WISP_122331 [Willisornis vidua]